MYLLSGNIIDDYQSKCMQYFIYVLCKCKVANRSVLIEESVEFYWNCNHVSLKLTDANSFLKGEAKLLRSRDLGEKFECKF